MSVCQGQGLEATLHKDKVLTFEIKSGTRKKQYGNDKDMFDEMMRTLKSRGQEVKVIRGQWSNSPSLTSNFDEFNNNIANKMSPRKAAFNTWTGKQARKYGYTKVKITDNRKDGYVLDFYKP